jgi:hypothetical protein
MDLCHAQLFDIGRKAKAEVEKAESRNCESAFAKASTYAKALRRTRRRDKSALIPAFSPREKGNYRQSQNYPVGPATGGWPATNSAHEVFREGAENSARGGRAPRGGDLGGLAAPANVAESGQIRPN